MTDATKRLYRSRSERWLAGVCGGIGNYLNLDATVIRVLFVIAGMVLGGGLLVYIILWLIIPLEPLAGEIVEVAPPEEGE